MSFTLNTTVLGGYVGRDPELKTVRGNMQVANFSVAKYTEDDNEVKWYAVSFWGKAAEDIMQYVKKGVFIVVVGHLKVKSYTKQDGTVNFIPDITGRQFIVPPNGKSKAGEGGVPEAAPPSAPSQAPQQAQSAQAGVPDDSLPF